MRMFSGGEGATFLAGHLNGATAWKFGCEGRKRKVDYLEGVWGLFLALSFLHLELKFRGEKKTYSRCD